MFCLGEECPVSGNKQHKTLCNQYYECDETENGHTWILKYCEEGLIYNPTFGLCVLPGKIFFYRTLKRLSEQTNSGVISFSDTDENWECTPQMPANDEIRTDSDNVNVRENLNENIEYVKWFQISQVPTNKPEINDYERYGKSKTVMTQNPNDEDNYESSGFGSVDVLVHDKNNVINTQILRLNQLMKDAKSKSSESSILATQTNDANMVEIPETPNNEVEDRNNTQNHIKLGNRQPFSTTPSPDKTESPMDQNTSKTPVISEDILKVLLEFSKELLSKPHYNNKHDGVPPDSYLRQTLLQPIVRPIYINVPVQNPSKQQQSYNNQNPYNPEVLPNINNQDLYYTNLSQVPLVDSYGYPIASHLFNKNTYYPYQPQQYQYFGNRPTANYQFSPIKPAQYNTIQPSYDQHSSYLNSPEYENYDTSYDDNSMEVSSEEIAGTKRFAYLGGTVFPYDQYKNSIMPYLKRKEILGQVEVLTCSSTSRQPNKTDCTKYFVCNPQTGVHPYSCPLNTAFNEKTKFCDVKKYKECKKMKNREESLFGQRNKDTTQLHYEMLQAIEELKQLRKQTVQLNRQSQANLQSQSNFNYPNPMPPPQQQPMFSNTVPSYINNNANYQDSDRTESPQTIIVKQTPRKRLTCLQPGKVADPDSSDHYYVCFKTVDNILKLHKMKCPQRFTFCRKTLLCNLPGTCA